MVIKCTICDEASEITGPEAEIVERISTVLGAAKMICADCSKFKDVPEDK